MPFDGNQYYGTIKNTLEERFGCRVSPEKVDIGVKEKFIIQRTIYLAEVDSFNKCDDFNELLGYINTLADNQRKGATDYVK